MSTLSMKEKPVFSNSLFPFIFSDCVYFRRLVTLFLVLSVTAVSGCGGGDNSITAGPTTGTIKGKIIAPVIDSGLVSPPLQTVSPSRIQVMISDYSTFSVSRGAGQPVAPDREGNFVFENVPAGATFNLTATSASGKFILKRRIEEELTGGGTLSGQDLDLTSTAIALIIARANETGKVLRVSTVKKNSAKTYLDQVVEKLREASLRSTVASTILDETDVVSVVASATSNIVRATLPPAPREFTSSELGSTSVKLSWSPVEGATSYTIFMNDEQYQTGIVETFFRVTGLTPLTNYSFSVAANNENGTGPRSTSLDITTLSGSATSIAWLEDLNQAKIQAAASGKKILIYFRLSSNEDCMRMESETWTDPDLISRVREKTVAVRHTVVWPDRLVSEYSVQGVPWIVLADSAGNRLDEIIGYASAATVISRLSSL